MKDVAVAKKQKQQVMNPKMFILILLIGSITMTFAALTSAYLVKQSDGNWQLFDLPNVLKFSTLAIVLSSATMHWSVLSAKKDEISKVKIGLIATTVLGFVFLGLQYIAWTHLQDIEIFVSGNPSGSFVYILTGLHFAHIISGLVYLLIILGKASQYKIHSKSLNPIQMCAVYWHFLDILWVYLFVFLLINR